MYSTLKKSLLILMVLPFFCFGQEDDLLKELESLSQNENSFELPSNFFWGMLLPSLP